MSLILTIIYVLWRRYPGATRLLQQRSMVGRKRRKKSPEPEQNHRLPAQDTERFRGTCSVTSAATQSCSPEEIRVWACALYA
ncbi:leucine-rich repeat transmembrane neuronal protein 4-like protein [Lates japonicus]|uniref:Leucine-rich repeat transmembrane neuronal protein 4-like protein n=1 Tax=Lates japonicus TaxID=270547 RepID=A0AAD3N5R2_LATJO|nr:leucine-rich repeat transmembrane neuronal protein 4-like protein [Lates japonicus]